LSKYLNPKDGKDGNYMPWFDQVSFNQAYHYNEKEDYPIYNYPITGLTYEQAVAYANWCSRYWTDRNAATGINIKVSFRLLSPAEFEKYEERGITTCFEKTKPELRTKFIQEIRDCKNEKRCALCNYAKKDSCESNIRLMNKFGNETYPVAIFFANCLGVFDMQGNVAEMTNEKGVAKGGSYITSAKECLPQAVQHYDAPQPWLGFRLIVTVEKTK
ncbi:MAG TPA: hypothetical protein DGG95_16675, partial [Cytophagales bacterium]|nr:hypothetical protein [Cytophagales bacterium]